MTVVWAQSNPVCEAVPGPTGESAAGGAAASPEFLQLIPRDFAREHLLVSIGVADSVEQLLVSVRTDPAAIHNVRVRLGRAVRVETREDETIARLIDESYASVPPTAVACPTEAAATETDAAAESIDSLLAAADRDLLSTSGKGPIIKLLDAFLFQAVGRDASDVHIQPVADRTLVRYRVDGVLHTIRELPLRMTAPLVSRIKVMGRMDIAERRIPQDGRASVTIGAGPTARTIDLRISTLPTSHGERAVIRLLESAKGEHLGSFAQLGMPEDVQQRYLDRAGRANGIVLVTGPTGSGKTTTLYATLCWIARRDGQGGGLNVMTIEDPIEYELSTAGIAISQAQVNARKGVTFATGLRHILRQDPDVVMVGEIRDVETARIAIQASLTGHLVFSTLHTNDAASALARLVDLGVEPYLISASLSAVLAQRLVRTVHDACTGDGCLVCFSTGLLGRTGVFELLVVDDSIRSLIIGCETASAIREAAVAGGMRTLENEGRRLVEIGVTTPLEVERVVHGVT